MTTPQVENGFTMIANELLEAILGGGFSHREQSVIFAIIRKTYGYAKREDDMSASQIGAVCGVARQHVTSTLNALAERNVINKRAGRFGMIIGVQKDHRKWISAQQLKAVGSAASDGNASPKSGLVPNQDRPQSVTADSPELGQVDSPESGLVPNQDLSQIGTDGSPKSGQVDSPESGHTKENLPKENLKIKSTPKPPGGGSKGAAPRIELKTFLADCKASGERPLRDYTPLWNYVQDARLPLDFVALAWVEFMRRFGAGGVKEKNKQANWRQTFRNYVERNYLKLWAIDGNGEYFLTTLGKQAQITAESKEAA
jgi:phage replication O-like protein O